MRYTVYSFVFFVVLLALPKLNSSTDEILPAVKIRYPKNSSVIASSFVVILHVLAEDHISFIKDHGNSQFCIEIDQRNTSCHEIGAPSIMFKGIELGQHILDAFIQDSNGERIGRSDRCMVSVGTNEEVAKYLRESAQNTLMRLREKIPKEKTLMKWYSEYKTEIHVDPIGDVVHPVMQRNEYLVVIGVKTSAKSGFPYRQVIRETWKNMANGNEKALILFVIGRVEDEPLEVLQALALEKAVYNDTLLGDDINVEDSYYNLVQKTTTFIHYAIEKYRFSFLMMTDDDIYLRLDHLIQALDSIADERGFYAGQVWEKQFGKAIQPYRDVGYKNFVSEEQYPMKEFPPFAIGPHYILSADCAEYIADNYKRLRGIGTLEDVSIAFWLLSLQVHAQHVPWFANAKSCECHDDLASYADLSPYGIRKIHENLIKNNSFCDGYSSLWAQQPTYPSGTYSDIDPRLISAESPTSLPEAEDWYVQLPITIEGKIVDLHYNPSKDSKMVIAGGFCSEHRISADECSVIVESLGTTVLRTLPPQLPRLASRLWTHNAQVKEKNEPFLIAISDGAQYIRHLLGSVFTAIYPNREILFTDNPLVIPDVFVFSVLDGGCSNSWDARCQEIATELMTRYSSSSLIMVSGEAWDTSNVPNVPLVWHTVSDYAAASNGIYLPVVATSFGERYDHSPMDLLSVKDGKMDGKRKKFCAYLYSRCDREERETFYDLLNEIDAVDALGVCQGNMRKPRSNKLANRQKRSWHDDAVKIYREYKFVIAFENTIAPGYVTEKIVNAMLAGSIPIFYGHHDVKKIFNPKSFINCNDFADLKECAKHVIKIHRSDMLYNQMVKEPWISPDQLNTFFSWHPDVPGHSFVNQVKEKLSSSKRVK